jgi:beta-N-acetylhexosaminidase
MPARPSRAAAVLTALCLFIFTLPACRSAAPAPPPTTPVLPPGTPPAVEAKAIETIPVDTAVSTAAPAPATALPTPGRGPAAWAAERLAQMSLSQKVGQLILSGAPDDNNLDEACDTLQTITPAGVTLRDENVITPAQLHDFTARLQACAAAAGMPPLLQATAHEGQYVTRFNREATVFPSPLALGAANDLELSYRVAQAAGVELAYAGVNLIYGPTADVLTNLDNEVVSQRTYGGDPAAVAAQVAALVRGYREAGLLVSLKHFPGHGGVSADSHRTLPVDPASPEEVQSVYLPPFRAGLQAGAELVMLSHVAFPKLDDLEAPASLSPALLGLLRGDLGFAGPALTDAMEMRGAGRSNARVGEASLRAILAGADLLLLNEPWQAVETHQRLVQAVESGELPLARVEEAARRVLVLKAAAGLSDFPAAQAAEPDWAAHRALAFEAGYRSPHLFRDPGGALPLPESARRILVVGLNPDWPFYREQLEPALAAQGRQVTFALFPLPDGETVPNAELTEATLNAAGEHDLILLFTWQAHLNRVHHGETWQGMLAEKLARTPRPLVVVMLKSPTDLLELPGRAAVVALFGASSGALQALLDLLTGGVIPSGINPLPGLK